MLKRLILFLALVAFQCEGQLLVNHALVQSANYDAVLVIGDSKSDLRVSTGGTGSATAPTLPSGIAYQWQRAPKRVIPVTTPASVLYGIGSSGGWFTQFAKDYNAYSQGRKIVLVQSGKGNTKFVSAGDSLSWYTNGLLYDSAKKRANDCLTFLGRSKIGAIIIILGVNGVDGAVSETTAITSLITRLNSDFGNPNIYINIPDKQGVDLFTTKSLIKALEVTYSNVHCTVNEATIMANNYTGDQIHFNQKGSNVLGHMLARYMTSGISDPDIRRVLTCNFVNDLTSSEETAWSTFISTLKTAGHYTDIGSLQVYKASSPENKLTDINGLVAPSVQGSDISNTGYIACGGTSTTYINTRFSVSLGGTYSQNDFLEGSYLISNAVSAGTQAVLFGANSGSVFDYLRQSSTSSINWGANGGSINYTTDTNLQNNTEYTVGRSGATSAAMYKNGTSVTTSSGASSAANTFNHCVCARGVSGGGAFNGEFLTGHVLHYYYLKGGNLSTFLTALYALESSL